MKLNLGCGSKRLPGYVNVDKYGSPEVAHDLETFPWPWPESSIDEVLMSHVLEHLGRDLDVFIGIIKELYRVCKGGAVVEVKVPHPRSDDYMNDPTHVRPVTPEMLCLFSRKWNEKWISEGRANTPLAVYHGVDFEITDASVVLAGDWLKLFDEGKVDMDGAVEAARRYNNVIAEYTIKLKVVK